MIFSFRSATTLAFQFLVMIPFPNMSNNSDQGKAASGITVYYYDIPAFQPVLAYLPFG